MTIAEITKAYSSKLDLIDIEILISHVLKKPREFVMAHPEHALSNSQIAAIESNLVRRTKGEPIAYIVRHKEFYGLDFLVNKHTLVPRPETELIVEQALDVLRSTLRSKLRSKVVVDVGTGSGNIVVSIAKSIENLKSFAPSLSSGQISNLKFIGIDISKEALAVAKKNARLHGINTKITFLHGNLLDPLLKNDTLTNTMPGGELVVTANLPYVSTEIYKSASIDVKKFEPKSALYSAKHGLAHYEELLKQLKKILVAGRWSLVTIFLEISPEQKIPITKLIKSTFPKADIAFTKDLAGKWRVCEIFI